MQSKIAICKELKKAVNINYHQAELSLCKGEVRIRYDKNNVIAVSKEDMTKLLLGGEDEKSNSTGQVEIQL